MENPSLQIGDNNWAVKDGSILGYNIIQDNYLPQPIDFTRASTATRVNAEGLIEGARTNSLLYSEQFDNPYWTKALGTLTANATTAPDGTLTADLFTKTSALNTVSQLGSSSSVYTTTGANTLSVYIKPNVGNSVLFRLDNVGNTANFAFNFTTKTFSSGGANTISSSFDELPNGWFRIKVTGNVTSTAWSLSPLNLYSNPTSDSFYVWGAQLETGNVATEYIPTTTTAVSVGITSNVPRIDYTTGSPALLLEPQRTNAATQSTDLSGYSKLNISVTASSTTSPDGTTNANTLTDNATNDRHGIFLAAALLSGVEMSISCYAKAGTSSKFLIGSTSNASGSYFDLDTETIVNTSTFVGSMQYLGNGWYRCTTKFTAPAAYNLLVGMYGTAGVWTYSGVGDTLYAWGLQVEQGSYATSLIPTSGTAVTRVADSASKTGISSLIGQTEGTLFAEVEILNKALGWILDASDGTATNRTLFFKLNNNQIRFLRNSTTQSSSTSFDSPILSLGVHKIALAYQSGNTAFFIDGVQISTTNTATFTNGTLNKISLGTAGDGSGNQLGDRISQAILFPTRLSNTQLATLTTL